MDMHPRDDPSLKIMLEVGEFSGEIAHVVIIDKRHSSDRLDVFSPLLVHESVSNQIAQRFGAVRVFLAANQRVEIVEQMMIQRDPEPDKFFHGMNATDIKFVLLPL